MNEEMENLNRETHVFPRGSGTNYHKLGGLKQEQRILVQFCRPETNQSISSFWRLSERHFLLTIGCFVLAFYVYHNFIYMPDNVYKRTLDTRLSNVYAQN